MSHNCKSEKFISLLDMSKTQGCTPFIKQCFVSGAVCLNALGYACMVGFPAVLLPQLREPGSIILLTRDQESWITSLLGFAVLAGNFITPAIMDRLGRRPMHKIVSVTGLLGWVMNALSTNFSVLLFARTLLGIGLGMTLPLRSALIGEYTSPKNRGSFLALIALSQCSGIFLVHLLGTLLHWQTTALICAFFPFTSLIMIMYSPESPSFLAVKGKYEECKVAFRWLRGLEEEKELEELIFTGQELEKEQTKTNFRKLHLIVKKKQFFKPILIMIHMNIMMQFCGAPLLATYSTTVIGLVLGSTANVHMWMIFLDGFRTVLNIITVFVMDKFERRIMLFSTGCVSVLAQISIAVYVYLRNNCFVGDYQWIPIILINLQVFAIAVGLIPIPNVIAGEIFPLQFRAIGASISIIALSIFTFVVLKTFPYLVDNFGIHGTYGLHGFLLLYTLVVNWFLLPESKGKTLLEIEVELRGRNRTADVEEEIKSLQQNPRRLSTWSMHSMTVEM